MIPGVVASTYVVPSQGWSLKPGRLTADAFGNAQYGCAVAFSGNGLVMAVGVMNWPGSMSFQGGVYLYDMVGGLPVQRGDRLTPSDANGLHYYGHALALSHDGSVLFVGAPGRNGNNGCVYVYDIVAGSPVQRPLILTGNSALSFFGGALACNANGTVLVVGELNWNSNRGLVYVFRVNGGNLAIHQVLAPPTGQINARFGSGLGLSADAKVLVVGSESWTHSGLSSAGGIWVFDLAEGVFDAPRGTAMVPSDAGASDYFGSSLAVNSDASVIAVGAKAWVGSAAVNQGCVYLFDVAGGVPVQRPDVLVASDAVASDYYGISVAMPGDMSLLAVGAKLRDGDYTNQGSVYLYDWTA